MRACIVLTLSAALLAGCGGSIAPPVRALAPAQRVSMQAPNALIELAVARKTVAGARLIGTVYSQWATNGPIVARFSVALSGKSAQCVPVGTNTVCTGRAYIPPGNRYEIALATYAGGAQLASAYDVASIHARRVNRLRFTTNAAMARVSLTVQRATIHALDSSVLPAVVTGYDASDNAIVARSFARRSGKPATIGIAVAAAARNAVYSQPRRIGAPGNGLVELRYDASKATTAQVVGGFAAVVRAVPTAAGAVAGGTILHALAPQFSQTTVPTSGALPEAIAAGPDGAMWFCEFSAAQVGRVSTSPLRVTNEYQTHYANPYSIAAGSDGAMWIANWSAAGDITRIATDGTVSVYDLPSNTYPAGLSAGPDGALWFGSVNDNYVSWITTAGTLGPHYGLSAGNNYPLQSATGSDGNVYFTLEGSGEVAQVTPQGVISNTFVVPGTGAAPQGIVSARGSLYFIDTGQRAIFRMTTTGAFTRWDVPSQISASGPLAVGPDGKLWFATDDGAGRLNPDNGRIAQILFPVAGSGGDGIAVGPDGALYLTEALANAIARLQ